MTTPRRTMASEFKEIRTSRDPLPCPDAEDMMVIQLTLVEALQAHSDCVVTATLTLPPLASTADEVVPSET
jgi:hypothetical protein